MNLPLHVDVPKRQSDLAVEKIFQAELGKDIVTAQLDMSCDKIINKILYYLSELPI